MKKNIGIILSIIIIATVFIGGAVFMVIIEKNRTEEYVLYSKKISECLLKNEDKYKKFITDCVSSLNVEENAYAIDSCSDKAKFLYCGNID